MPGDLLRQRRVRLAGEHRNRQCIELSTLRHGFKLSGSFPIDELPPSPKVGWGGRIIRPCGPHPSGAAHSGVILPQPTHALGPFSDRRIVPTTKIWLGWKDSNLRMAGSKPAALPLGDTPTWANALTHYSLSSTGEVFRPRATKL